MEERRGELRKLGGEERGVVCGVVNVLHHGVWLGVPALSYKPEFIFYQALRTYRSFLASTDGP